MTHSPNANLLMVEDNIKSSTSTQLPPTQKKFYFKPRPYDKEKTSFSSEPATAFGSRKLINSSVSKTTISEVPVSSGSFDLPSASQHEPTITGVYKILNEHGNIMRALLREIKLLQREQRLNNIKPSEPEEVSPLLQIPTTSPAQFEDLEKEVNQNKSKEMFMIKLFEKVTDQNLDKFIRACLKLLINDHAASSFSWYGEIYFCNLITI